MEYEPRVYLNLTKGDLFQPIYVFVPSDALQKAAELEDSSINNKPTNTVRVVNVLQKTSALFPTADVTDWVRISSFLIFIRASCKP